MNIGDKNYLQRGVLCLLQLKNIPIDKEKLRMWQETGWDDVESFVHSSKTLGINIKQYEYNGKLEKLAEIREPLLLLGSNGHWQVLGQSNQQQAMVLDPVTGQSKAMTWQELADCSLGMCFTVHERLSLHSISRNFGLGWFLPVLNCYQIVP